MSRRFLIIREPVDKEVVFAIDFQETDESYRERRVKVLKGRFPGHEFWFSDMVPDVLEDGEDISNEYPGEPETTR